MRAKHQAEDPPDQPSGPGQEHGHGHGHGHGPVPEVDVRRLPGRVLLAALALALIATVVGLAVLWPDGERQQVDLLGKGVTTHSATVVAVGPLCPVLSDSQQSADGGSGGDAGQSAGGSVQSRQCNTLTVTVRDGPDEGSRQRLTVSPDVALAGLVAGDSVDVIRVPATDGQPVVYGWFGVQRDVPLGLLAGLFVLVVAVVARIRGLLALVGLGIAGLVIGKFMLPALLSGSSGLWVALVGSSAIMFVVLYLAHGPNLRTSTALAGTLIGLGITAGLGIWAVSASRLSGVGDESGQQLLLHVPDLSFRGLLSCAVVVAGLGVLNDVTITQASAAWELRAASPDLSRAGLFGATMRIGRDHIASTIYTIVFAYAGSAMALMLLISLYDRSLLELLSEESIAEEVVRTLASAIGLVAAVPVTTAIAVAVLGPRPVAPTGSEVSGSGVSGAGAGGPERPRPPKPAWPLFPDGAPSPRPQRPVGESPSAGPPPGRHRSHRS